MGKASSFLMALILTTKIFYQKWAIAYSSHRETRFFKKTGFLRLLDLLSTATPFNQDWGTISHCSLPSRNTRGPREKNNGLVKKILTMNSIFEYLTNFFVILITLALSSCGSVSPETKKTEILVPTVTPTEIGTFPNISTPQKIVNQNLSPSPSPPLPTNTVTVNIYYIDSQCENLIPMPVAVPEDNSLEAAVAQILEWQDTRDLSFSYRVIVDRHWHLATIDLRVSPNSRRQLTSLSTCEQIALFSSLEKTLTSNSIWNIKEVRFTEMGEEIWL